MRRLRLAVPSLAVVLLLLSTQAAGAIQPRSKVKQTASPIWTLALDGPRVAYASGGRVYAWNVATGATSVVRGEYSNAAHSVDASELAIAGNRVAWIKEQSFGNTEQGEKLYTASLGGRAHLIRHVYRFGADDPSHTTGGWIDGVVGSGDALAVSTWRSNGPTVTEQDLDRIVPTGLRPIAGGPDAVVSASAQGGHIAVLRPTGSPSVGIYSVGGTLLREVAPAGNVAEIALSGNRLVVLTWPDWNPTTGFSGPGKTVEVYDWTTGALLQTWPVAAGTPNKLPGHLAVSGRLAVYAVDPRFAAPRSLHLLDLTSGKDVVIAHATGGGAHDAVLGSRGLVYVVNNVKNYHGQRPHGKLAFVPTAALFRLASG